jgi:hypothetical protein
MLATLVVLLQTNYDHAKLPYDVFQQMTDAKIQKMDLPLPWG